MDPFVSALHSFVHSFIHEHFRFISSAKVSYLFYFLRSQRQSHLYDLMSTPTATLVVCHSIRAAKAFDIYSYVCKCMFRRLSPDFCGAAFEKRYMETGCYVVPRVFWCVQCKSAANSKSNEACSPDPETFCTYLTIFLCFQCGCAGLLVAFAMACGWPSGVGVDLGRDEGENNCITMRHFLL